MRMTANAECLDWKLKKWHPMAAGEAHKRVTALIRLVEQDSSNLFRSRRIEREMLDPVDTSEAL